MLDNNEQVGRVYKDLVVKYKREADSYRRARESLARRKEEWNNRLGIVAVLSLDLEISRFIGLIALDTLAEEVRFNITGVRDSARSSALVLDGERHTVFKDDNMSLCICVMCDGMANTLISSKGIALFIPSLIGVNIAVAPAAAMFAVFCSVNMLLSYREIMEERSLYKVDVLNKRINEQAEEQGREIMRT